MDIASVGAKYADYAVKMRRYFHQHPELSEKEYETSKTVAAELTAMGIPVRKIGETGLLATINGGKPGKTIILRADLDGLAVKEETGLPFASENEGVMHACGHDAHLSMLLTAAKILMDIKDELNGEIRLLFESAEEVFKGVVPQIEAGSLEGADTVFGMHIWSAVPDGKVCCMPGPRMASTDLFYINIDGVSAHGAMPHNGVDAIIAGTALVDSFQTIVSREVSPFEPVVITVGEFKAGEQANVLAGHAYLSGTVRTFNNDLREEMPVRMQKRIDAIQSAYRVKIDMNYWRGPSAVINDPERTERARASVKKIMGDDSLCDMEKTAAGETFAEYMRIVPGVMMLLGTGSKELGTDYPQHNCHYNIDENMLLKGAEIYAQFTLDTLNG